MEDCHEGRPRGGDGRQQLHRQRLTSNHDKISAKETSTGQRIVLHVIDGVGLVHALLLRIQALLPIKTLVLSGH